MQNEIESSTTSSMSWKKLDQKISVSHFSSSNPTPGYNPSQIYVKKYEALQSDVKKNVTVFLLHDIGQYHGRFQDFIDWSRKNNPGITFVAMDFVGHGLSSGTRGHFEQFDHLARDFHYFLEHYEDKTADEKWIIAGHGMGGLVALDLMNQFQDSFGHKIDGLILSNFILKFNSLLLQLEEQPFMSKSGIKKILGHSRPLRILKGESVLTGPDSILNYEQDPLVIHRPTFNSLKEIQKKVSNIYQESYFLGKPLLIMKSDYGDVVSSGGIEYFSKGIKKELLTEKIYSLMKHDLYNEREKEKVYLDIMNWMKLYEI